MPRPDTPLPNDTAGNGFIVAGPRKSDPIGGALRAAFARQEAMIDDFSALLYRIDLADREAGTC